MAVLTPADDTLDTYHLMTRAFVALRIFTGLVWFSNALAKIANRGSFDWGFIKFGLVSRDSAKNIAASAAASTNIPPLGAFYHHVVLPHWGFFGIFLTIAELAIGVGLLLGIATRLAALGGLLLLVPIWLMLLPTGAYLWEYPAEDLFPLLLLTIVPTGRHLGLDRDLASRIGYRWPF